MKITPALIPHTEFHTGTWLLPVDRPDWYYFQNKRNGNTIEDKNFINTVDKPLRGLVKWLHKKGIATTPSCSGHHMKERNLKKIFASLEQDGHDIRNGGLKVKDVETGKEIVYKEKNYSLPWNEQEFIDKASVYQQKGIIGLRLGRQRGAKARVLKMIDGTPLEWMDGVKIFEKDSVVLICTSDDFRGNNKQTWKKITYELKRALA